MWPRRGRRDVLLLLLQAGVMLGTELPWCAHAQGGSALRSAAGGDSDGLARLAIVLEKELSRHRKAVGLPWKDSIVTPAASRVVWYPRRIGAKTGGEVYRVGFDPLTRWYFVAQVSEGSVRPRYYGPLDEAARGQFVEALGVASVPNNRAAARKPGRS